MTGGQLVTNCDVISDASRIEIEFAGETRLATAALRDSYRDLCFLDLPGYRDEPVPMIEVGQTRVGLDVAAAGCTHGAYTVSTGRIIGLHHVNATAAR